MKAIIKSVVDAVLARAPRSRQRLAHYLTSDKLATAIRQLQGEGIVIDVVYDIGARHGEWTRAMRSALPQAEFFLFEANEKCVPELLRTGCKHAIGVLSSEEKVVQFYDTDGTGDSYYKETTSRYDTVAATERTTQTLDAVVRERGWPSASLIKLDTQGSELDILRGGANVLRDASLVYLECPTVKYNSGAPTFQDYIDFLGQEGFVPCELCELHHAYGALVQVDVLFVRKEHLRKMSPAGTELPAFLS